MKKILTSLAFGLAIFSAKSQNTVTVQFTNLAAGKGSVVVGIYNIAKNFTKNGQQLQQRTAVVKGSTAVVTFANLPAGDYGVAAYQDENSNGKCDVNFIGIPKEGYGFSNNFHPKLSAPKFDDVKFHLAGSKAISIKIIH